MLNNTQKYAYKSIIDVFSSNHPNFLFFFCFDFRNFKGLETSFQLVSSPVFLYLSADNYCRNRCQKLI